MHEILVLAMEKLHFETFLETSENISEYLSVFSPNAGKYGTEKAPYLDTFHAVIHTKDLDLFISSIQKFTSYYVAFNHPIYARWTVK